MYREMPFPLIKIFEFRGPDFSLQQGSKGIRQWSLNWHSSQMMILMITHSVDYNSGWKVLTLLNEPTNQNTIKVPKFIMQTKKKTLILKLSRD